MSLGFVLPTVSVLITMGHMAVCVVRASLVMAILIVQVIVVVCS